MKLYMSGNSPYARRARITIREAGLLDRVEEIAISGFDELLALGPGAKIPILVTDSGASLSESIVVTRYLNDLSGGGLLPSIEGGLEACLATESIACILMDSIFVRSMEKNYREESKRSDVVLKKEAARCKRCYDALEALIGKQESQTTGEPAVTLASIAVISALGYANWRAPEDDWQSARPQLTGYFNQLMARPAFAETAPGY